ncbi:phospholipase D-like domain-containing protein [Streptomyces zaomyceticus]
MLRAGALAAALLATIPVLSAAPAEAETAGVTTQAVFNNPIGTAAERWAIVNKQVELVNGAPAGSRIRVAMYYAKDGTLPDALISAHARGVQVQAIFDNKVVAENQTPYNNLVTALGSDTSKPSWVIDCGVGRGCVGTKAMNGVTAIQHNKFMLFTETQGTPRVVVQSSANLNDGRDGTKGWNNALVLAGNDSIYNAYNGYFDDLAARRANNNYYDTGRPPLASGNAKIHFYPRAATSDSVFYSDPGEDTVSTVLDNVTCHGNSIVGTTDTHRTRIRVSMTQFARPYLADRLNELDAQGCYIEVAMTYDTANSMAKASLEKLLSKTSSAYGGVITKYYCGKDATWIHDKYLLVEGNYYGVPDRKIVWTGSHNWTTNSLRQSDETMLQLEDAAIHDAYVSNYNKTRAATTHQPANGDALATC